MYWNIVFSLSYFGVPVQKILESIKYNSIRIPGHREENKLHFRIIDWWAFEFASQLLNYATKSVQNVHKYKNKRLLLIAIIVIVTYKKSFKKEISI